MLDFRYFISSLAAVFLALGIGIVIGGALIGNDDMVKSQENLIFSLEQDFQQLRSEKKFLQEDLKTRNVELEVLRQFNREVLPLLISAQLIDRKIALIKTNETINPSLVSDLMKTLRQAGAQVPITINISEWPLLFKENKLFATQLGFKPEETWVEELFSEFMEELISGENGKICSLLQVHNLMQVNRSMKEPIDTLVLLGGSYEEKSSRVDEIDLLLAKSGRKNGLTVIGAEPLSVSFSYIPKLKNSGLTTVDNIDTLPGQVALIFSLASGQKGNYGVKETARALLPEPLAGL